MILLTNDDGIEAPGLRKLHEAIAQIDKVVVVAPETEQSAMGHGITLSKPLKVRKVIEKGEFFGYGVSGTPADCIKIALTTLLSEKPRLVISGINHGGNLGTCVVYSGTVSAATEAAIMGFPAIAVSLNTLENPDFSAAASFIRFFAPKVIEKGLPERVSLNVNIPAVAESEILGIAFTRQSESRVIETFVKQTDPNDNTCYWMSGEMRWDKEKGQTTDSEMVNRNYVSVTPIHPDLTHFETLREMKNWNIKFKA